MANLALSPLGLFLAGATSVTNVFTDVARKKVLDRHELISSTMWIRAFSTLVFAVALAGRIVLRGMPEIRDGGPLFGVAAWHTAPAVTFLVYLAIDVFLVSAAAFLYFHALKVSPMSVCVPFLAFTPIFLIPTGYLLLGELAPFYKLLGVVLIVIGSLVMHRKLFAQDWLAPAKAIIREKGSRDMLAVAFIFALSNPIEKKLVLMSDVLTQAFCYSLGVCLVFLGAVYAGRKDCLTVLRQAPGWTTLAGLMEGAALGLQLASYKYIDVVITISIKRAGIVLAVFAGWLIFKEKGITDKLIAASVMVCGVLILYLPMTPGVSVLFTLAALCAMAAVLWATRGAKQPAPATH
jgi:drug/metabolite transporter (DMT)-like permease